MFEIKVGEVMAVEEVGRKLLQAAAGQVHRVYSLGHHLSSDRKQSKRRETVSDKDKKEGGRFIGLTFLLCFWAKCQSTANRFNDDSQREVSRLAA